MKSILILLFGSVLILSKCSKTEQTKKQVTAPAISYANVIVTKKIDSLRSLTTEVSPIKIITAKLLKNEYSHHKDIRIIYKNLGKKDIKAIKFEWFCINSFDKPANGRYFFADGRFTEDVTSVIKSKHTKTQIWEDFSTDADKVTKIRAYYIVYADGTQWGTDTD
jgi:hypothetical protein